MKKTKVLKTALLVIAVILFILIAIIIRRAIVLSSIDKKVTELENNNNNFYIKNTYKDEKDYTVSIKRYIKKDISKLEIEKITSDGKNARITEITYPEKRKMFTDVNGVKTMREYNEKSAIRGAHMENKTEASYTTLNNPAYSTSINELIINSIVTSVKSTNIDGKDCYVLSSKMNTNFLYNTNTTKMNIYVEKETGLTLKVVEEVKENNEIKQVIKDFEYQFNNVSEEEIREPDISEYKIQENS